MTEQETSALLKIKPKERNRIMDLVSEAGIDVSDWHRTDGAAASNPKYCYEWSYVDTSKVCVLNLWYEDIYSRDGKFHINVHARSLFDKGGARARRARKMDEALKDSLSHNLPIRIVLLHGKRRSPADSNSDASRVEKRLLDPEPWGITSYDWNTGRTTLTRGEITIGFTDQFTLEGPVSRNSRITETFARSAQVRMKALIRSKGKCEWCGNEGFKMPNGKIFLETHHVIPLSENGPDSELNVIAICPNHHREAHYGVDGERMKKEMLEKVKSTF